MMNYQLFHLHMGFFDTSTDVQPEGCRLSGRLPLQLHLDLASYVSKLLILCLQLSLN